MKFSFLIKTTGNRKVLKNCIQSILDKFSADDFEILVSDEPFNSSDEAFKWKKDLYDKLVGSGHKLNITEERSVTKCRNALLNLAKGDVIVRLDDDFEFGEEFSVENLKILLGNRQISFVCTAERQFGDGKGLKSGAVRYESGHIQRFMGLYFIRMMWDTKIKFKNYGGVRFASCSYSRNCIFLKREDIGDTKWNENLQFEGEHVDFFLRLFENGVQGCITPDIIHWHREDLKEISFLSQDRRSRNVRSRKSVYKYKVLAETWGNVPIKYGKSISYTMKMIIKRIMERVA